MHSLRYVNKSVWMQSNICQQGYYFGNKEDGLPPFLHLVSHHNAAIHCQTVVNGSGSLCSRPCWAACMNTRTVFPECAGRLQIPIRSQLWYSSYSKKTCWWNTVGSGGTDGKLRPTLGGPSFGNVTPTVTQSRHQTSPNLLTGDIKFGVGLQVRKGDLHLHCLSLSQASTPVSDVGTAWPLCFPCIPQCLAHPAEFCDWNSLPNLLRN